MERSLRPIDPLVHVTEEDSWRPSARRWRGPELKPF